VDALTSLTCLLVGIALPLAALFLVVQKGMRQLAVAEAYGNVSRRLSLPVDTRGVSLHGYVDDQRLWVGSVMVGHGPDRELACWGVLDLPRPLAMGLVVRRRGLSERLFRRSRGPEVTLPDAELERLIEVHGDDAGAVRQLLRRDVMSDLKAMVLRWRDVVITDQSVRVHLPRPLATTADLQELVDGLRSLAGKLCDARLAVTPSPALAPLVDRYGELAEELGLALVPAYPGLQGELDGRGVMVSPGRAPRGYSAEVRLQFRDHPAMGLVLFRQEGPDGYWSVGQDIQVGAEGFDDHFVVKGWDPVAVVDKLRPAQDLLLELAVLGEVALDDHHLRVRGLPLATDTLRDVVALCQQVADELRW